MPKEKKKDKPGFSNEYGEEIKAAFLQIKPEELTKDTVLLAAKQLVKLGLNPGAVIKILKAETGFGFSIRQVAAKKEREAPVSVEKLVEKKVTTVIASEAARTVNQALATGQGLEKALGPIAKNYGFDSVGAFVVKMYDFYSTYKGYIKKMDEEVLLLKGTIKHLAQHFGPESRKALRARATWNFLIELSKATNGKLPPPETLQVMIKEIKEEFD